MKRLRVVELIGALCLLVIPATGESLPWDKDMRNQPSVKPQEALVSTSRSTVPADGKDGYPPPKDIVELVRARLEAGRTLVNPVPKSPESLNRGREMYQRHCLVCHGEQGHGDGPVGQKFVPQPMELNLPYVQRQPDGQIFYTISHGSIAMPFYRQAITVEDRWNIVNFVKETFGSS